MIVGIPRTRVRSTVSIWGQNGNAASAMTSALVWRIRQSKSHTCGLMMPLVSMLLCQIIFLHVIADHAVGAVLGDEGDHGAADFLDPLPRDAVGVAGVKGGNDFLGQNAVKIGAIAAVLFFDCIWVSVVADRETIRAVVSFAPPSIYDGEIQAAMAAGFLSGGARSFERAARIIEPNVAAGNHLTRDMHVIVLDKDEPAFEFAVFAEMNDVLNETLPFIVARMGLARENKLNRPVRVVGEFYDVFEL